jgi:hypothetical protein
MTTPINLTQLREHAENFYVVPNITAPTLLALIDTAEAAIEFVHEATIATIHKRDGDMLPQGGTSTIHTTADTLDRLRETLNHYTTTP